MKRWLAAALGALMMLTALGGCAKTPAEEGPTAQATPEVTPEATPDPTRNPAQDIEVSLGLWGVADGLEDPSTQWVLDQIFEKFGVKFVLADISALAADSAQLTNAQLPQVMTHPLFDDRFSFTQLLNMNLIRPLNAKTYEKYERINASIQSVKSYAAVDDQLYFVPRTSYAHESVAASSMAVFYRADWAAALGKTWEGTPGWDPFIDLLKAYTYNDPDGNGKADVWGLTTAGSGLGGLYDIFFASFGVRDWVLENGTWVPGLLSAQGKEALKWANYAYRMGYLDQQYSTLTVEDAISRFCAGRAGALAIEATPYYVSLLESKWAELQPENPLDSAVALMAQPVTPYGVSYQEWDYFSGGVVFRKDVDDKTVDRVMQVLEWLRTTPGLTMAMYGQEGTDYTIGDTGAVSQVKDADGKSILFLQQNSATTALAQLSTYAKDGANPGWRTAYQNSCMDGLRASWWKNAWGAPMFSDYIMSITMATYNPGGMLETEVARMMINSADVEADWDSFKANMTDYVVVGPAQQEVNDYAAEKGITAEE
ncbi:MAG: hypothetical protein PHO66_07085 [Eubacteriales bacterium]|nr:hypothetical protein [Eubacteriales bacterium]